MKNLFRRLMNFLLIFFIAIGLGITFIVFDMENLHYFVMGFLIFLGIMGGLNYVLFGKFTVWNEIDS